MKIVLATKNQNKLRELKELAGDAHWLDLQLAPDEFDPEETGETFLDNAVIKAKAAAYMTKLPALADDSGIEVQALDGAPGVRSARYCEGTDRDRRLKLLREMENVEREKRGAAFVCAMALCGSDGELIYSTVARWEGFIGDTELGENGFGYDPIFYLKESGKTSAEISPDEKNSLSHRGQAWRSIMAFLQKRHAENA